MVYVLLLRSLVVCIQSFQVVGSLSLLQGTQLLGLALAEYVFLINVAFKQFVLPFLFKHLVLKPLDFPLLLSFQPVQLFLVVSDPLLHKHFLGFHSLQVLLE